MKKPHALIGLLAALGTVIGVLVAVVGMPYGRLNYTAFAGLYHNGTPAAGTPFSFHLALDCLISDGNTIQDYCLIPDTQATFDLGVTIGQETGATTSVGSFNFSIIAEELEFDPLLGVDANFNGNPDADDDVGPDGTDFMAGDASWTCGLPAPNPDNDGSASVADSELTCYLGLGATTGSAFPVGHTHIADVHYSVVGVAGDIGLFTATDVNVTDFSLTEFIACPDATATGTPCFPAQVEIIPPPPATATNTTAPANTATVTPTPTNTPLGGAMFKDPEAASEDDGDNLSNLYLCVTGPCAGPGEGSLMVIEKVINVTTQDNDGDTDQDGLGAYEFQVKFDHKVIESVTPEDIVFSPGGAGATRGPATCDFSLVGENDIRFGCTTTGPTPDGPLGNFDLAKLTLIPESDLTNIISPGNDNGIVTVLLDENCELADVFGHPTLGSVNGGLLAECGDLAVTVRILEGDVDLDCDVDLADQQAIAARYGSYFGNLHYSKWFDLEPWFKDLDIDIKDLQKVFGRDGSTCQDAIPDQPNQPPPAPFG